MSAFFFQVLIYEDQTKIMAQQFTKNISYIIHSIPYNIIYSHVQTIA